MKQLLKVSLGAKLAGANLLIVLVAWGVAVATHRGASADWRLFAIIALALAIGLAVNLVLVSIALRPIRDLERTASRVWAGDLETRVPRSAIADPELAQVGGMLNFLLNALSEDRARVRMLASEVVRTGDRERGRVGKELHDSVAQSLAAIRYQLIAIERETTDAELTEKIRAVRQSAGELLEQVRVLSHTVHPQILEDLGLIAALRHLARTTTDGPTISVSVSDADEPQLREISKDIAVALYRVAHESVSNTFRHGEATSIGIRLGLDTDHVVMQVEDNGKGFVPELVEREGSAMGLFTMRERIALLHGVVEIASWPKRGTTVSVRVPLERAPAVEPARGSTQVENQHAR